MVPTAAVDLSSRGKSAQQQQVRREESFSSPIPMTPVTRQQNCCGVSLITEPFQLKMSVLSAYLFGDRVGVRGVREKICEEPLGPLRLGVGSSGGKNRTVAFGAYINLPGSHDVALWRSQVGGGR